VCKDLQKTAAAAAAMSPIVPFDRDSYVRYIGLGSSAIVSNRRNSNSTLVSLWNRQPHCLSCYTTDTKKLTFSCGDCGAAALCSDCHKACAFQGDPFHDRTVHPQNDCDNWRMLTAMQGMSSEQGFPLCIDTETPEPNIFIPNDWTEFFEKKSQGIANKQFGGHKMMLQMAPVTCMIADGLSTPLTILHGLSLAYGAEEVENMDSLLIHMVGATIGEMRSVKRYMEISHCLPNCKRLKIVMVGPDMSITQRNEQIGKDDSGRPPQEYRCDATHDLIQSSYEEYYVQVQKDQKDGGFEKPDLIYCQHSGVEESGGANFANEWDPAISIMCSKEMKDVPCMFTGYTFQESKDGVQRLKDTVNLICDATINPLRGLGPLPDAAHDGWYYANAAFFMFQGPKKV